MKKVDEGRRYTGDSKVPTGTMVDETRADKSGSWVAYKSPSVSKRYKTKAGADAGAKAAGAGWKVASAEFFADNISKQKVAEGYYATGRKSSYSDAVPQVKIILQHSRQLEEGERRYRAIERIFVENAAGERFLLDTTKPGLARVYARHIAEGGTPYDEQGKHIHSLCEEYTKMAGFVRATRNGQFNESTQSLVNEGVNHYNNLRETLHKMSGHRGYNAYFESWAPTLTEDEDTTDLSEMFASNELDPRIESVMPILRKLNKTISEMSETSELESWADDLIEESLGMMEGDGLEALNAEGIPEATNPRQTQPNYPDSKQGAVASLSKNANPRFVKQMDLPNCVVHADPQVEGVWAIDNFKTGMRVIVYLAGYQEPGGDIRGPYDDFEEGQIPKREMMRHQRNDQAQNDVEDEMMENDNGELGAEKEGVLDERDDREDDEHDMAEGSLTYGNKCAGPFASEDRARREASRISKELGVRRYVEKTADGKYIVVKKQGVAEGTGGRSEWDPNSSGYQGDYGGEDNWGNHERDDERHDLDQATFQLSMDGDVLPKTYSSKELARFAGQALLKQNPGAVVMLKTVSGLAEAKTWTNNMGDKQTYYDHDKPKKPDFAAKFKKNLDKTKKQADDTEDKIKQHDEKPVKEGVDPLDALKRLLGK